MREGGREGEEGESQGGRERWRVGELDNFNFTQNCHFRTENNSALPENKQVCKNEMLKVMALEVLGYVAASFHINPFCYTMADEIAYLSNYDMPPMGGQQFEFIGVQ